MRREEDWEEENKNRNKLKQGERLEITQKPQTKLVSLFISSLNFRETHFFFVPYICIAL